MYPGDSVHMGDRILREGMSRSRRARPPGLPDAGRVPDADRRPVRAGTKRNVQAFQRAHHLDAGRRRHLRRQRRPAGGGRRRADDSNTVQSSGPVGKAHLNSDGTATAPADAPPLIQAVIAAGNKIAFTPYLLRRRSRQLERLGLRLLGLGQLRAARRRPDLSPEDSGELESYGAVRGRHAGSRSGRTPDTSTCTWRRLRFDTSSHGPERIALDDRGTLARRIRRAPPDRLLIASSRAARSSDVSVPPAAMNWVPPAQLVLRC